jgi:hypothetical protein
VRAPPGVGVEGLKVSLDMCMYMYVVMYKSTNTDVYVCMYVRTKVQILAPPGVGVEGLEVPLYTCMYTYVCMYVYTYLCICIYVYFFFL